MIRNYYMMLEIELFKFDAQTDYLPYYKTYRLKRENVTTLNDVLEQVYAIEKFGHLENETFFLRANGVYTDSTASLDILLANAKSLRIEPLSNKRAVHDLIINTKDYQEKLDVLDAYISADEKASLIQEKRYMLEHYASNTLHFNDNYIGEHVLCLASELVQENASLEAELSSLVDTEDGIRLRTSLKHRVLGNEEVAPKQYDNIVLNTQVVQSFENFNIALYCALNTATFENVILQSKANYVALDSKYFDIPMQAKNLSFLLAGTILLEALDNNADFLIVNDDEEFTLFDGQQKAIEKTMGREIQLPVLTRAEFVQLLQGERTLPSRKVALSFLG